MYTEEVFETVEGSFALAKPNRHGLRYNLKFTDMNYHQFTLSRDQREHIAYE